VQPRHIEQALMVAAVDGECLAQDGVVCALSGNVDWLNVELADVQMKRGPAAALYVAYRQHGERLIDIIGGRFAFLLWDSTERTALLACDRFGQMPVYWATAGNGDLVFSQTATGVAGLLPEKPGISPQGMYNYLYFHMVPGPGTIYSGVNKLMAGHMLRLRNGSWQAVRYWDPSFDEHADEGLAEAGEEMLGLLSSSVARLAAGADCGAFLSGGLDSSTVAGLLARHHPRPKTYSIGFDAEGYDETAYARIASEHFDTDFQTYYVTPDDVLAALPRIAAAYDEPFGNSSALPAYFCARFAAEDGRQRLLAGDGGDELFAGNERYAKQEIFERYGRIPDWARRSLLEPLVAHPLTNRLPKIGKARSYIQQANVPLPDRLQTYNFINRLGADSILSDEMRQAVDLEQPRDLDREIYSRPAQATRLNRMLYLDWHHTLADNDLRKVNRMCQLAGIEVEYPMLDDRLVEFSTRVSSQRKMRGGRLRDFYKHAVDGFLPPAIINKSKHGFGLPFGVWMAEHPGLQELANDNLLKIRQRNIVRPEFIDELTRLHGDTHSGYYGEFIWVLMMLELWMSSGH
jgi:asparagine synthase (glutamine-hydrolysing)